MELSELRRELDEIDEELLDLFLRRMELSRQVAVYKKAHGLPVLNAEREQAILEQVTARAGAQAPAARELFSLLLSLSRARQETLLSGNGSVTP